MTRQKFGWEREEQFAAKRLKLAESIIEPWKAGIVILGGLAFLFLVFFVAPLALFGPSAGLLTLVPLMALFALIAWGSARLLRIKDEPEGEGRPQTAGPAGTRGGRKTGSEEEA